MNTIKDIQNLIKSKIKLCIFVDYESVIKQYILEGELNSRYIRILQNFSRAKFIKLYIITSKDSNKNVIKKLQKQIVELPFSDYSAEEIEKICLDVNKTYLPIYFGENVEIINKIKELKGYTITLNEDITNEERNIQITKRKFEDILLETNNLYL